jgi:hypothetical protein
LRFYVEGLELDVQDPKFFMDEVDLQETNDTINEMLEAYYDVPILKQNKI